MSWMKSKTSLSQFLRDFLPTLYFTIQLVIVILYIKYERSILYSCRDILDEKFREKEKWINIGKNKQENNGSQSHDTTCRCLPVYQI